MIIKTKEKWYMTGFAWLTCMVGPIHETFHGGIQVVSPNQEVCDETCPGRWWHPYEEPHP